MKMNRRSILLIFFVILLPLTIVLTSKPTEIKTKTPPFHTLINTPLQSQPKDSEVVNTPIPIHHWLTENGSQVYFVPIEGLPVMDIVMTFDAGSVRDGDKPGLASLLAQSINLGTKEFSAEQIAEQFNRMSALFDSKMDRDKITLSLHQSNHPDISIPNLQLFADIIAKPSFPNKNILNIKSNVLSGIKKNLKLPEVIAIHSFFESIYNNHPYAHSPIGTVESIANISKDDLENFHQQYFVAKNATLTIVGSIHRDFAKEIAKRLTEKLPSGNKAPLLPEVTNLTNVVEKFIPNTEANSQILLGQALFEYRDPDYFSLIVGNTILGNGNTSYLYNAIQENQNLNLNIKSSLIPLQEKGPFVISLQTKNLETQKTITTLKKALKNFIEQGPDAEIVIKTKELFLQDFSTKIDSPARIAQTVSTMAFYNLPINFLETYENHVREVTRESIQTAFESHIDPQKMALVVVGGRSNNQATGTSTGKTNGKDGGSRSTSKADNLPNNQASDKSK